MRDGGEPGEAGLDGGREGLWGGFTGGVGGT